MQNLIFSIEAMAPIFLMVLLGMTLKQWRIIDEVFLYKVSFIVYRTSLPAMIFINIAVTDFQKAFDPMLIGFGVGGTIVFFCIAWLVSITVSSSGVVRGSIIHGAYRGNFAIIGFAVVLNLHGESGLAKAAVLLSFIIPLYNVLAVFAHTIPVRREKKVATQIMMVDIITNPLILVGAAGMALSFLGFYPGHIAIETGNYLSAMALPLALIGVGGSLDLNSIGKQAQEKFITVGLKLVACPILLVPLAYWIGMRGENLVILFTLFSTPTAIVSYIIARSMDGDAKFVADIVLLSTLISVVTLSAGVFMLKTFGII